MSPKRESSFAQNVFFLTRVSCSTVSSNFAEKCGDYKGFTLSTLLNDTIDRDGISPTRIFGLTREEAKPMLRGLSARYPKFIDAAFTHDLEKITLSADKSSADVLKLFEGEEA